MEADRADARDRLGRRRSPATFPGSRAGVPSKNKGRRRAEVVLTPAEVRQIMDYWATKGIKGIRNRAIIRLIYWEGLRIEEALRLEPGDWDRDRNELTLPPRSNAPRTREGVKRKKVRLSASSRELLVAWWEARSKLHAGPRAPLFCQVAPGRTDFTIGGSSFRGSLRRCAKTLGLMKQVNSEALRASGRAHRLSGATAVIEGDALGYLHEDVFQLAHPHAYEHWSRASELMRAGPEKNATTIGHECREALTRFALDLTSRFVDDGDHSFKGSIDRLRAVVKATGPHSKKVAAHLDALIVYWGTTLDLAHRQEHGAERNEALDAEDARRLVFHTMIVMYEWDRFARRIEYWR
jgi:integrase